MNIKRTIKILVMISGLAVGSYYGYQAVQKYAAQHGAIRSYGTPQDEAFIKNQFKENWYTLIATPTYDVDFMLEKKAPNDREPQFFGKIAIKMLYESNQPIGFITYYMQTSYQGDILFLVIGKEHRGKRHGEKLLNYAFNELKKQGAKTVKIFTRTENTSAQKLYTRIGFVETHRYTGEQMPKEGGVFYRKQL